MAIVLYLKLLTLVKERKMFQYTNYYEEKLWHFIANYKSPPVFKPYNCDADTIANSSNRQIVHALSSLISKTVLSE